MRRRVEPEWLDELPAHDPRARRSREDLRRINALMGNARIVASELRRAPRGSIGTIAEIGAGDGAFASRLAPVLGENVQMTLVDMQDIAPAGSLAAMKRHGVHARVVQADVFDWLATGPRFDAIVANLFVHHFEGARLAQLLRGVAGRTRLFIACEPRRSAVALTASRLLWAIGCNDVTRHDAVASVRAGFEGDELGALWPTEGWTLREGPRALFSHCFVASRNA